MNTKCVLRVLNWVSIVLCPLCYHYVHLIYIHGRYLRSWNHVFSDVQSFISCTQNIYIVLIIYVYILRVLMLICGNKIVMFSLFFIRPIHSFIDKLTGNSIVH